MSIFVINKPKNLDISVYLWHNMELTKLTTCSFSHYGGNSDHAASIPLPRFHPVPLLHPRGWSESRDWSLPARNLRCRVDRHRGKDPGHLRVYGHQRCHLRGRQRVRGSKGHSSRLRGRGARHLLLHLPLVATLPIGFIDGINP